MKGRKGWGRFRRWWKRRRKRRRRLRERSFRKCWFEEYLGIMV